MPNNPLHVSRCDPVFCLLISLTVSVRVSCISVLLDFIFSFLRFLNITTFWQGFVDRHRHRSLQRSISVVEACMFASYLSTGNYWLTSSPYIRQGRHFLQCFYAILTCHIFPQPEFGGFQYVFFGLFTLNGIRIVHRSFARGRHYVFGVFGPFLPRNAMHRRY